MNKEYKESSAFGVDFLKNEGEKIIQLSTCANSKSALVIVLTNYGSLYEIADGVAYRINPELRIENEG